MAADMDKYSAYLLAYSGLDVPKGKPDPRYHAAIALECRDRTGRVSGTIPLTLCAVETEISRLVAIDAFEEGVD